MSLRLRGDLGKWQAVTGNSALGISQSLFTVTFFIQLDAPSAVPTSVMGMVAGPIGNAFFVNLSGSVLGLFLRGVTTNFGIGYTLVTGKSTFVTLRLDSTGTSTISIDGIIKSSKAGLGVTTGGTNQVYIGTNAATPSANYLIDKLGIANSLYVSDADMLRIRDGLVSPQDLSFTSYYLLDGIPGNNPTAADAAMHDQISANDFVTIPGTGGTSTNAVYDSAVLIFHPSITVAKNPDGSAGQISRSGGLITTYIGTNPDFGDVGIVYPSQINDVPTFKLNGNPLAVSGPFWSSGGFHRLPYFEWLPYLPGTPPTAITLSPADVVTWTTPSNWAQAPQGVTGAETGTCGNYVGGYEPGLYGYSSFDSTANPRTFRPGWGHGDMSGTNSPPLNMLHRTPKPWSGALTSTDDGYPLTVSAGGTAQANAWSAGGIKNWLDLAGFPIPWGTWTLIGDEQLPANPCVVSATVNASATSLLGAVVITPGTIVGGVEINKKWEWTVARGAPNAFMSVFTMKWKAPTGLTAITLKNAKLFQGGDTPRNTIDPVADISDNFLRCFSFTDGVKTVACSVSRSLAGSYPNPSWVEPDDLPQLDRFSYSPDPQRLASDWPVNDPTFHGNRQFPIRSVGFYDIVANPYVYNGFPFNERFEVSPDFSHYRVKLADWGLTNSWSYATTGTTNATICKFVCAQSDGTPVPHNLTGGGFLTLPTVDVPCSNDRGSGTCHVGGFRWVWPISPTEFIADFPSTLLQSSTPGQLTGVNIINKFASITMQNVSSLNIEQIAATSRAGGNPAVGFCITHCLSDAGVREWATRALSAIVPGTEVTVQYSNELFLPNNLAGYPQALGSLAGYGFTNTPVTIMRRTHQITEIFKAVWTENGADPADIKVIIQPNSTNSNLVFDMLTYAQNNGYPVDYIAIAPYINMEPSDEFTMLAAMMAADDTRSIAHTGGPGGTQLPVCSIPAYNDAGRHSVKYSKLWNGPTSLTAGHIKRAIDSKYGTGVGPLSFVYPFPKLILYEGGTNAFVPNGVSHTHRELRTALAADIAAHSSWYDVVQVLCQFLQQPGPAGTIGFVSGAVTTSISPRSFANDIYVCTDGADNNAITEYSTFTFQGQPQGLGLSNLMSTQSSTIGGNGFDNSSVNEAVAAHSYGDWLLGAESPPPATSFVASPASVQENQSVTLNLFGINTAWSGASVVVVTNSLTGTTSVTAGTFTASSPTTATLGITVGAGVGTWRATIDGVNSQTLSITSNIPVPPIATFVVLPLSIVENSTSILSFVGSNTTWTAASVVSITNSVTGTTTVTKGAWQASTATSAILFVTTGHGVGTWKVTIDGVDSSILSTTAAAVVPLRRTWLGAIKTRRRT